jgi:hypothetical protein
MPRDASASHSTSTSWLFGSCRTKTRLPSRPPTIIPSNKGLSRPGWRKINSRQELEEAYKGGSAAKTRLGMKLYRIEGADGELWGYFFAPDNMLPYSVIDDKTIELGRIPEPKAPGP